MSGTVEDPSIGVMMAWSPDTQQIEVDLAQANEALVWIQVRDEAGNTSEPISVLAQQ